MSKIDYVGPAFPHTLSGHRIEAGMTLRDYFAAKAMQELNWDDESFAASECYKIADAMLKAREVNQ